MASKSNTIPKNPVLETSQDYLTLRSMGIEFIETLGSRWWTDYNSHDPGITLLEALCYAITDLGYRTGWDIRDLLTPLQSTPDDSRDQAFFTARDILTISPLTTSDYRRLLVDTDNIANAWLQPKTVACETDLYANCEEERLSYTCPPGKKNCLPVTPLGTYDILLELEDDPVLGDLNDRKIRHVFILEENNERYPVTVELRFPEWDAVTWGAMDNYIDENGSLLNGIKNVEVIPSLKKSTESITLSATEEKQRWQQWQRVFFADITIHFEKKVLIGNRSVGMIELKGVPFRMFGVRAAMTAFAKESIDAWDFKEAAGLYLRKMAMVERTLKAIGAELQNNRNLCEDFCSLRVVRIQDVAVCADIDVTADADIELVLANVLFTIEQYFNPGIKFYTIQELMAEGMAVEDIFEGPQLSHGFIKESSLQGTMLKDQLRTSDIIEKLVEIDGIIAVRNLLLSRYDEDGLVQSGGADGGEAVNRDKPSAEWTLDIDKNCQPRLYIDNSSFIFYKNGLPFTARPSEVQDTLNQLRGQEERLKIRKLSNEERDLSVPEGTWRQPGGFAPVQYLLPQTYGTGPEGVREPADDKRRSQARQLKAYLMVFEQVLANAFSQLANIRSLFSLDQNQRQSYFVHNLNDETLIRGVTELLKPSLTKKELEALAESEPEQLERRNRFLDHLMARFGEQFSEHALMLTSHYGDQVAARDLIAVKSAFLKAYPLISRNRAKSFNYRQVLPTPENQPALRKRISLLLGLDPEMETKIIIVEHLLLRPKFPGDALMEVCLGKSCPQCGEEDPYSFQYTVVMPGWAKPFDSNIELRRFADRTIRMEMPAHLLGKICWVSNLELGEGKDGKVKEDLANLLREEGRNARNSRPGKVSAANGASKIYTAAQKTVTIALQTRKIHNAGETENRKRIINLLHTDLEPLENIYGGIKNYDLVGDRIYTLLADHFARIVEDDCWLLYDRFREAWEEWLKVNAGSDWRSARVIQKIESALPVGMISRMPNVSKEIAMGFGVFFSDEMKRLVSDGKTIDQELRQKEVKRIFSLASVEIERLTGGTLTASQKSRLRKRCAEIYADLVDVSMKLWKVLMLLSKLHSVYPPATLHDCDDGNDENPVRLGSTRLG